MAIQLSSNNPVISADVLVRYGIKFALGADIMKLGNRQFEKEFSPENMTGTENVYFTMTDGGQLLENGLDLNAGNARSATSVSGDANLRRVKKKTVKLDSITMYYKMNQEDLDLLIKEEEYGSKMTARAVERVNEKAFNTIKGGANAIVANAGDTDAATAQHIVDAFMKAQAYLEASKMDGQLCGMASVWNDLAISAAYAKSGITNGGSIFKASQATGLDAGKGFLGFSWAKATAGQNTRITALDYGTNKTVSAFTSHLEEDGSVVVTGCTLSAAQTSWAAQGRVDSPFTIAGIYCVDELGQSTGVLKTFTGVATSTTAITFDVPLRFNVGSYDAAGTPTSANIDPLANGTMPTGVAVGANGSITVTTAPDVRGVLTKGKTYYQPCLVWKKDEFLVAAKGLMPMCGVDSKTIPSNFGGEKGILPWRGTAWAVPEESVHKVRFDAYIGFGILKGIGIQAIYIEAA